RDTRRHAPRRCSLSGRRSPAIPDTAHRSPSPCFAGPAPRSSSLSFAGCCHVTLRDAVLLRLERNDALAAAPDKRAALLAILVEIITGERGAAMSGFRLLVTGVGQRCALATGQQCGGNQ